MEEISRGGGTGRRAGLRILSPTTGGVSSTLTRDTLIHALSKIISIILLLSGLYKLATSVTDIFHIQNLPVTSSVYQSLIKKFAILLATSIIEATYGITLLFKSAPATKIAHIVGGILLLLISITINYFQ